MTVSVHTIEPHEYRERDDLRPCASCGDISDYIVSWGTTNAADTYLCNDCMEDAAAEFADAVEHAQ